MKLYDKGEYGHNKILTYINVDMHQDVSQCNYCQKADCSSCADALQSNFVNGNIIHRLYYTIFQMAKSYVVSNPADKNFHHSWVLHKNTFNQLAQGQAQREIRKFTTHMDTLRECRNKSDYEVSDNHRRDRNRAISFARSAMNNFTLMQNVIGSPKC